MSIHARRLPQPASKKRPALIASCMDSAALTALLFALAACGPTGQSRANEEKELLSRLHTAYDRQLSTIHPDYVVVTFPESIGVLPEFKRQEFAVIRAVLGKRRIRHEFRRRDEAIEEIVVGKGENQKLYRAFVVPAAALESCQGGLLLYVNLDVKDEISSSRHPEAASRDITVKVWNDPVTLPKAWLRLYPKNQERSGSSS